MREIPTEDDWDEYTSDLDQEYAHRVFTGKSNQEVQDMFDRNVIERTDELRFMPVKPFQYYILGFRDYILHRNFKAEDPSDAASCFIGLVEEKLKIEPRFIMPVIHELMKTLIFIAEHQREFDADEDIYGSFGEALVRINQLIKLHT
jgi:hypothetical protein